jgi:hypothetical protein
LAPPVNAHNLTTAELLHRNDIFSTFMEFMESMNAPPYLRFWTNADIYRQFASLSDGHDSASVELMRNDAQCIFDAHFAPSADLPIRLVTHTTYRYHVGNDVDTRSIDPRVLEAMHDKIVANLRQTIQDCPNADCFKEVQALVLRILDTEYVQRFRDSKYFRKYAIIL